MGFLKQIEKILRKLSFSADMFKAPACLRARGEPEVSRLCPGVLSVILGFLFIAILIIKFVQLLNYDQISSSMSYSIQQNLSAPSFNNITIAVSPSWQAYSDWSRKFFIDISLYNQSTQSYIPLETELCRAEQWQQFKTLYQKFVMSENWCVKNPEDVQLQGTSAYLDIQFLQITIKRCTDNHTNNVKGYCNTNQTYFNQSLESLYRNQSNFFSLYIKDTSVNTLKKYPVQQYIPLNFNIFYNNITRKNLNIFLGTYTIETDTSIWPIFESIQSYTGYYITEYSTVSIPKRIEKVYQSEDLYGRISIAMSTNQIKYSRKVGKIDDVLGYAGGLFGLLLTFFGFFVVTYNKYSHQLLVAEYSFNYKESGEKVRFNRFNYFRYIKFQIYDWLKVTFNKVPDWKDCYMIYDTKDQANLYLDVQYLFRKMRLIDLGVHQLVNGKQEKMLYLTESPALPQVADHRAHLQYYNSIIQSELAMNIQDLQTEQYRSNQIIAKVSNNNILNLAQSQPLPLASPGQVKTEQDEETTKLKEEFRRNLKIQDQLTLDALASYKELYNDAKEIQLEEEIEEAEVDFAEAYMHASDEVRREIVSKIPLKILFRLSMRMQMLKNEQNQTQNKQKNENKSQKDKKQSKGKDSEKRSQDGLK